MGRAYEYAASILTRNRLSNNQLQDRQHSCILQKGMRTSWEVHIVAYRSSRSTNYPVKSCNIIVKTIILQSQQITIIHFTYTANLKGKCDENERSICIDNKERCWFTSSLKLKRIMFNITGTQF